MTTFAKNFTINVVSSTPPSCPVSGTGSAGSDTFQPIPNTNDTALLAAILNCNAKASSEYGGDTLSVYVGDIIMGRNGVCTDSRGVTWTLEQMPGNFAGIPGMGSVRRNGADYLTNGGAQDDGGGHDYICIMRIVNGVAYAQNAKGIRWWTGDLMDNAVGDPGPPDPNSSAGGVGT